MDYFKRLETLMARLRAKRGCPWDRRQTHKSLMPYLLEETHEVLEAIESRDARHLREELGDLLLQVVFHARIAQEKGRFDLQDVAKTIGDKLLRRHPHVFGKDRFRSIPHLKRRWEELKRAEKPHRRSVSDGVPKTLPALLRAQRIHEKVTRRERPYSDARLDRDLARAWNIWGKARRSRRRGEMEKAAGSFLLSFARLCQASGVHSEMALRRSIQQYEKHYRRLERRIR